MRPKYKHLYLRSEFFMYTYISQFLTFNISSTSKFSKLLRLIMFKVSIHYNITQTKNGSSMINSEIIAPEISLSYIDYVSAT